MALDASVYNALGTKPMSVADYDMQNLQLQQNMLNLQATRQALDAKTQDQAEKASLRNYLSSAPDLSTAAGYNGLMAAAPTLGPGIHKAYQDSITSAAKANLDNAQAGNASADAAKTNQQAKFDLIQHGIQTLTAASTPDAAKQAVIDGVSKGYWSMQDAQQKIAQIPADPNAYQEWRIQQLKTILPAADLLKANMPTLSTHNTGGSTVTLASDPLTGKTAPVSTIGNTVSPDTVANNATSRANNAANINKDLTIAGMKGDGSLSDNLEAEAQMIASGRIAPPSGMAATRPAAAALMRRVSELNPEYDATTYGAKTAAAKAFTSGPLGNALRSVQTANNHLDQLTELADAMDNHNPQVVNKVVNYFKTSSGDPSVTNFDAIKNIVGQEVVKAIVAGGGSAGERDEAAKAFSDASSPAQLHGAITHYRMVMRAQQQNLLEQRRAAGLPDSTIPNYGGNSNATPALPSADAIAAELKRRGGQ